MGDNRAHDLTPTSKKAVTLIAMRHGGTHLIQPIIRHMIGRAISTPKGQEVLRTVPGPKLVIFARDPRNRMVSHFRYKFPRYPAEQADMALAQLMRGMKNGLTPITYMQLWASCWCDDSWAEWPAYRMTFEHLMIDPVGQVGHLRDYLDAPGEARAAVEYTLGKSGTWTGRHSRWQEWFGPESLREWERQGGDRLVRLMGYD